MAAAPQIAAVRQSGSPARKAARLAGAVRSGRFMARVEEDMGGREARMRELQVSAEWCGLAVRWPVDNTCVMDGVTLLMCNLPRTAQARAVRAESGGRDAETLAAADLREGAARLALLGWDEAELAAVAGGQASDAVEGLLNALLHRAEATAAARAMGKGVDAAAVARMRADGLEELQERKLADLRREAEERRACAAAEAAAAPGGKGEQPMAPAELPSPQDHLAETVALLACAAPSQLAGLLAASGPRKLLLTYRTLRSQVRGEGGARPRVDKALVQCSARLWLWNAMFFYSLASTSGQFTTPVGVCGLHAGQGGRPAAQGSRAGGAGVSRRHATTAQGAGKGASSRRDCTDSLARQCQRNASSTMTAPPPPPPRRSWMASSSACPPTRSGAKPTKRRWQKRSATCLLLI